MATISEIEELIRSSGNSFHAKVARRFSESGWHVVVSPYYMDQSQNKAREIDLVVEKEFAYRRYNEVVGHVVIRLFVECKYVATPSVFWFADKDIESARELVCSSGPFRDNNKYTDRHHYLSKGKRVAKLFASTSKRDAENEPFFKALNQVLNAMVSMRGQSVSIPQLRSSHWDSEVVLEYPVIVCSSFENMYSVNFDSESVPEPLSENFQLEVRYAYVGRAGERRNDYFLLDFVDFAKLSELAKWAEEEAQVAGMFGFGS